jgi:hypothetical protein
MQRSTYRILTTHAGSLTRPADLLEMVRAKEASQPYDHAALAARVHAAVAEVVGKQIDAGAVLQRSRIACRGLAGDADAGVARLGTGYHLSAYKRTLLLKSRGWRRARCEA